MRIQNLIIAESRPIWSDFLVLRRNFPYFAAFIIALSIDSFHVRAVLLNMP